MFLFCQIVSELDVEENLSKPDTLPQRQASTFNETDVKEARQQKKSCCDIL